MSGMMLVMLLKLWAGAVRITGSVPGMDQCELQSYWGNFTFIVFGTQPQIAPEGLFLQLAYCNILWMKASVTWQVIKWDTNALLKQEKYGITTESKRVSICSGVAKTPVASVVMGRGIEVSLRQTVWVKRSVKC